MRKSFIAGLGTTIFVVLSAIFFLWTAVSTPVIANTQPNPLIQQLETSNEGLSFSLTTKPLQVLPGQQLSIAGLTNEQQVGAPALPYYQTYLVVPPNADVSVQVTAVATTQHAIGYLPPLPDTHYQMSQDGIGIVGEPTPINRADPAIYQQNALYPATNYTLSEPMYYRDLRLVALTLYPVQYNPVNGQAHHSTTLNVSVEFSGGMAPERPLPTTSSESALATHILNYHQATQWRSLPTQLINAPETELPIGTDSYKIHIDTDGIYEITGAELASAGMNIAAVSPGAIEMLYRGQSVAYEFIGDTDTILEPNEIIRFYGQAFHGPRLEKQHITDNIYWLWPNGFRTHVAYSDNQTTGNIATSTWYTTTQEPDNDFFSTWTNLWPSFPNEPDAWYWGYVRTNGTTTHPFTIPLSDIDTNAPTANYLVELQSRASGSDFGLVFNIATRFNGGDPSTTANWNGPRNVNITQTISSTALVSGTNTVTFANLDIDNRVYINRITVEYLRQHRAINDQIILTDEIGERDLQVPGFTTNSPIVWNVTNPLQPISVQNVSVSGDGPYTYTFGLEHPVGHQFIAISDTAVRPVKAISQYIAPNLNPTDGRTEWIAISHSNFITQAQTLANHRANPSYGGLETQVVNIQDVINQYGYGLPIPGAIRNYLTYALSSWTVAPDYVVLFGDTTVNPRNLTCLPTNQGGSCNLWDAADPAFVPTDLIFVDRFQGLIPSDFSLTLLTGDDLLADMSIGRIAAANTDHANAAVRKIIRYEQNLRDTPELYETFLFVADADDPSAGFFCDENQNTSTHIPATFNKDYLCLTETAVKDSPEWVAFRTQLFNSINITGTYMVNYRGHGAISDWSREDFFTSADTNFVENINKPTVFLSADCLDGHFAWPGWYGIGETYLRFDTGDQALGTAGHWGSAGLGYTHEHTILHNAFYDGLFEEQLLAWGDAVNYAKTIYILGNNHASEAYSFVLHGDPAMRMMWAYVEPPPNTPTPPPPGTQYIYLPSLQKR